ncbi:MAG: Gfo/Idh/MocA family oxidoreductase [Prevotellaceae bacterium]|jgi:predicted dehydrogenase|nr:Gfo/Idh/MocA family oxidoreductase [Prevotellaceae bacterium]
MGSKLTRRNFLKVSAMGAAGVLILPGCFNGKKTGVDNSYVRRVGFIGLGQQAMYLLSGFIKIPGVEVVAGADVYGVKRERFVKKVTKFYEKSEDEKQKAIAVDVYDDYREILKRKDINTVVIATPDHWHAFIAIEACKAKKDIYLEKPMTFTVHEGQELVKAVRENEVVLAVGSQQRSSAEFIHAVSLVQSGKLGKIKEIKSFVGAPPVPYDLPEEQLPADLDWKTWLGPNPYVHYNHELNPPISLDPVQNETSWGAWRWYKETGGGYTTDWGAHVFDIAQWALGMDGSGPVKVIPPGQENAEYLTYVYENGAVMTEERWNGDYRGCKFIGENGWIEVARDYFNASNPEWNMEKNEESDLPYETAVGHHENFIVACRERKDPAATVEIGHSSCTVCNIGNIAYALNRPLQWNPKQQKFVDDDEANALLTRKYADGFSL